MSEASDPKPDSLSPVRAHDPDDNLPPVSPPSGGFLMQLFIVPMVIVIIIVMVCLMFNWLAHLGNKPENLVADLTKLNPGSWQKALTIANMLCDANQAELRQNSVMARRLADILDEQIELGAMDSEQVKLRVYLCLALGVFEIDEGLSSLVNAASTQRDLLEIEVRMTALEAIARRADGVPNGRESMRQNDELFAAVVEASQEFGGSGRESELNAQLRSRAAYAFGVIGGEESQDQLARMTSDPEMTVRFNAATGLARNGDERSVSQLIAMLNPAEHTGPDGETVDKATSIMVSRNALRAITQLGESDSTADLSELQAAVQTLVDGKPRGAVGVDAKLALQALKARRAN